MSIFPATVGLGTGGGDQYFSDLLDLTADPYFPEHPHQSSTAEQGKARLASFLKVSHPEQKKQPDGIVERLSKLNLDLTRISNRILVMGRCWSYRTDREACRNNIDEVACFLNARYERSYLVFNFGSPDIRYDTSPFRNQVVGFPVSKMLTLTVKILFDACRAITSWLRLNRENVVVIQCRNGKGRSGLVTACLLRYCGLFDSAHESLEYFRTKRCPGDHSWTSVTLKRYLRYFNDILILEGRLPSSIPLQLHQVILTTIPDFDGLGGCKPGIEVFQEGRLIYSSAVRLAEGITTSGPTQGDDEADDAEGDAELLREFKISLVLNPGKFDKHYNPLVMMDEHNIIFKLEHMSLERDIQVRVYHHNAQAGQNVTILQLAFNTGFMTPGIVRLRVSDLEIPPSSLQRFDPEFALDLVLSPDDESQSKVGYETATLRSPMKDLMKLSRLHPVLADPLLARPLELQGHRKFFVKLALQLGNNDIHAAHEFLAFLSKSPQYTGLDRELTQLTRAKYEEQLPVSESQLVKKEETRREGKEKPEKPSEPQVNPILEAIKKGKALKTIDGDEGPSSGGGGLPFLAGLMRATASRKDQGILQEEKGSDSRPGDENSVAPSDKPSEVPVERPKPMMGGRPDFLAGLMKATSGRKSIGVLPGSEEPDPEVIEDRPAVEQSEVIRESVPINPNPPKAPPLPDYLRHSSIPPAPPLPDYLRHPKPANGAASMDIDLSVADDLQSRSSSPPPAAPPLPSFLSKLPPTAPSLPKIPAVSTQKIKNTLHWGEIRGEERIRNTIWSELQQQQQSASLESIDTLDLHKFEELFCINPSEEAARARKNKPEDELRPEEKNVPRILDSRRANNVGIGLSRFYKRMTNTEIVDALVYQQHLLDQNDLICLKAIIPTDEEREQLLLFNGDPKSLVLSEQFMLEMSRVPNLSWIIDALIFQSQFEAENESISTRLSLMTAVLIKIRESPMLKTLFRLVLDLGNLANYDYGRVPAHMRVRGKALGFTMDSLLKLHEVKSVDRKSSLLGYLLMVIEEGHAELLSLPSDFSDISTIKHWDSASLLGELEALNSGLNRIRNLKPKEASALIDAFRESQASFIQLAKIKLEKTGALAAALNSAWTDTAVYLGEDPLDKRPEELLIVFDQFFRHFKEAHEQNQKAAKALLRSLSNASLRTSKGSSDGSRSTSPLVAVGLDSGRSSPVPSEIATYTSTGTNSSTNI